MAISVSFNNNVSPTYIYRYNYSSGTFSSNLAGSSSFDYFEDTAVVGDYLLFGLVPTANSNNGMFRDIRLYVGTAFSAASVSFLWEYSHNASTWETLPSVVNGNAITNTGAQTVSWGFDAPLYVNNHGWRGASINSVTAYWIRVRITAVDTITEGGAQSTQPVYLGNNWITVSGGTQGTPANFTHIKTASDSNGWGVVDEVGNQVEYGGETIIYNIKNAGLIINDYFSDTKKVVIYGSPTAGFCLNSNGTFILGAKRTDTNFGYDGCVFIRKYSGWEDKSSVISSTGTVFKLYDTIWKVGYGENILSLGATTELTNSIIEGCARRFSFEYVNNLTINNSLIYRSNTRCGIPTSVTTSINNAMLDNIVHSEEQYATSEVRANMSAIGFTFTMKHQPTKTIHLRNLSWANDPTVYWYVNAINATLNIQQEYTLDLKIQDRAGNPISGVNIIIKDSSGTQVYSGTTDDGGNIPQQNLTHRGYFNETYSTGGLKTYVMSDATLKTPHTVTISKKGYQTKTVKYTMDRRREEVEVLEPAIDVLTPMGERIYKNLKPEDGQNKSLWLEI